MDAAPLVPEPANEARCQSHPAEAVLGTCPRCGTFFCELDRENVDGRDYCASCAKRPDVDYLEAFRLKYWGKRDLWAWLVGIGAPFNLALGLTGFAIGMREPSAYMLYAAFLLMGGVGIAFWLGRPFARLALLFLPVASMVVGSFSEILPVAIGRALLPLLFAIGIYRDTRNKLFFKVDVPREALQKAWHLYANNSAARSGILMSFFGLLIPVFAPFGLVSSIIGLRRVDPHAHPPIGRKWQAIAGIILGVVSILGWGGLLVASYVRPGH
jgi:hypothetical protein